MAKKKGPAQNPVIEALMDRRTVVLSGEISHGSIGDVGNRLLSLQVRSSEPIKLLIDSEGGSTFEALKLCDLISSILTAPIHGIAIGQCCSAATFIMLYCNERLSTRYAQFLIHSGTRSEITIPVNQSTSEKLEQLLRETQDIEETVIDLYLNRLTPQVWSSHSPSEGERRDFVINLIDRGDQTFDGLMDAEEAIAVGLIERIIEDKLDIFVD